MKTRRWMKSILKQARTEQKEMPWARQARDPRRVAKSRPLTAAE